MAKFPNPYKPTGLIIWRDIEAIEERYGIALTYEDYCQLRRDAMKLRITYTKECGYGNGYLEIADDGVAKWFYHTPYGSGEYRVPNPVPGCEQRIAAICDRYDLYYFLQTDPRGSTLYVHTEPIDPTRYSTQAHLILDWVA